MDPAKEPLLTENKSRYVLFPIVYPDIYQLYKRATSAYWLVDEISFTQDLIDIEKLSDNEKHFIMHVLGFFAASDGVVMENLSSRFSQEIPIPEVRAFYAFQNANEAVHSETYSLLIDTYVKDPIEKSILFNSVENFPAIKQKADWAIQWINSSDAPFAQRLVGFAIVEGIFFSASFCAIFWLRERGLLPGLSFANQLIARDESMHTEFACLLYSKIVNRLPAETVESMIREAVDIERKFITESIPCSMIGMNSDLMTDYIKFMADRLLMQLGYASMYKTKNPFAFMEKSAAEVKQSFFEVRVSEYSKPVSFVAGKSTIPDTLSITEDF
jgi:ribonucleoside-diphosphate reductase beta chain